MFQKNMRVTLKEMFDTVITYSHTFVSSNAITKRNLGVVSDVADEARNIAARRVARVVEEPEVLKNNKICQVDLPKRNREKQTSTSL